MPRTASFLTSVPSFLSFLSMLVFLMVIQQVICDDTVQQVHNNRTIHKKNSTRPIIHVFYEPIAPEQRFTSMTDDDDAALLDFWKKTWSAAGWEPRVLTLQDAKQHALYDSFQQELEHLCMDDFGKLSLLRWLAMARFGGGWMADYDAFPLHNCKEDDVIMTNNGEMTIYEAVAPILASGSADAWLDSAKYLLEHAKTVGRAKEGRLSFWTDTLGVLSAWRDVNFTFHVEKKVLDGRKAFPEHGLTTEDCNKRPFRGKRVVHFGHFAMLEASIAPELRLPRHRVTIAKQWLPRWMAVCGNETAVS